MIRKRLAEMTDDLPSASSAVQTGVVHAEFDTLTDS